MIIHLPATTKHIGAHLSHQYAIEMTKNRKMLLKILSSIRYLARQSLALRGRDDDSDGNLIQLLQLRGSEDSEILE